MITNQRQYRITKRWLERFQQARTGVDESGSTLDPLLQQALRDQYESQVEELREQIAEYEALQDGQVTVLELDSLDELPGALIRARTASGLSQKALARKLGLKEQQVQRYEATRYAGASLERIGAVADALGVRIREQVTMPVQDPARLRG